MLIYYFNFLDALTTEWVTKGLRRDVVSPTPLTGIGSKPPSLFICTREVHLLIHIQIVIRQSKPSSILAQFERGSTDSSRLGSKP